MPHLKNNIFMQNKQLTSLFTIFFLHRICNLLKFLSNRAKRPIPREPLIAGVSGLFFLWRLFAKICQTGKAQAGGGSAV